MPDQYDNASAAWGVAANLGSTAMGALAQSDINRKTRKWNEKMYAQQRADALADWNRQNEYNNPTSQMARLKAAGLNPNLVYGHGANTDAGPVRSSSVPQWSPRPADYSTLGTTIGQYQDVRMRQAQIDNLRTQNTVLTQDAILKAAQTLATRTSAGKTGIESDLLNQYGASLKEMSLSVMEGQLRNLNARTEFTLDENERQQLMNEKSLEKAVTEIALNRARKGLTDITVDEIRQRIENMKKYGQIQDFEIGLNKMGFTRSDPYYIRAAGKIIDGILGNSKPGQVLPNMQSLEHLHQGYLPGFKSKGGLWRGEYVY